MTVETGAPLVIGPTISRKDVVDVARRGRTVALDDGAAARMQASFEMVQTISRSDSAVYGVTTGFGALANTIIPPERRSELQHALIRSHAAGMGPRVAEEVVRSMTLLRARTLAMGYSGVRPLVARRLLELLNTGLCPVVPTYGSLGASGDLAPLAHVALCLIGEGEVSDSSGGTTPARQALAEAGLEPLVLEAKEGLALLNGTDGMLGILCLACADAENLLRTADVTAAMSIEALLGTERPFHERIQRLRPHPGQIASARNLVRLLEGSSIRESHRASQHIIQDSYSVRCTPQVLGAARDTLDFAAQITDRELASAVDNPVVFPSGDVESTGNFHGEPLAFACDFLAIAAAEAGSIAERRIDHLLDPQRSAGLPPFLATEAGVNSGLMIAQYVAASLVAENRRLAAPASVDSIPTSGMQEDHVSMGWSAGMKLREVLINLSRVLAVELICSARALDYRAPLNPAPGTGAVRGLLRERVPGPGPDRWLAPELAAAQELIWTGDVVARAQQVIGPLE